MKHRSFSSGQSLIEVIIITVIVATVLTAIASVVTQSLKYTAESKRKNTATSFAQEGVETFRQFRQRLGWTDFTSSLSSNIYCLNALPTTDTIFRSMETGECDEGTVITGTEFTREANVTVSATEVVVEVTVSWNAGSPEEVTVRQELRNIDQ